MDDAIPRYVRAGPPPAETLARLMSIRKVIGISRIADITGLDWLGIPVMQAVRPFALSNSVSQGKGADATAAAISAILESTESYFAERVACFDVTVSSANALQIPAGRFSQHLLEDAPSDWRDMQLAWVTGTDLLSGASAMIPFELVHTAYVMPPLSYDGVFAASTTGLAASLAEVDSVIHGILECVERDAIARANRAHGFLQRSRIDLKTIDSPAVLDLLSLLNSKGILVALWHAPSATGIPVVWCQLMETDSDTPLLPFPADGSAASLDAGAAIAHAIYEAAQGRLAAISGARDDITRASYPKYPDWERINAHRRLLAEGPCSVDFRDLPGHRNESGNVLSALLSRLADNAISNVLLVRIDTAPLNDLVVVRIVIPQLQPLLEG